jgi:hypothetical protein
MKNATITNRSFVPTNPKPIKALHFRGDGAKFVGETEPTWPNIEVQNDWTQDEYETHIGLALNWMAATQDDKSIISLALAAINQNGHRSDIVDAIKNSTRSFSTTAARIIRAASVGFHLRFGTRRFLVREIRRCVKSQKTSSERIETNKPSIQENLTNRFRVVRGELDVLFDTFIESDYTSSKNKVSDILSKPETSVPANRTKELVDHCQRYLDEYSMALAGKPPSLAEAYAPLGKRKIKAAITWWEQAITDINTFGQQKLVMRKTRKRKPQPPTKIVGKLKFLKTFPALKLASIEPTQLLKCSEVWVYNTKLRKIGIYVTLGGVPFEIKGTRLTNIDPLKSVQKTLRKPDEQLKEFSNYSKAGAIKWFNNIRAVATKMREAINGDSILLKGVK